MVILIRIEDSGWEDPRALRERLSVHLPSADIRCWPDVGDESEVEVLMVDRLPPGQARGLPRLRLVQKLGAGVETILADDSVPPHVQIARLQPTVAVREMAEYCMLHVLREQWHLSFYAENQRRRQWEIRESRLSADTRIGVMGLGHFGATIARTFISLGFSVTGLSRTPKSIEGVDNRHGSDALLPFLSECDHVIAVLPSTPATRGLMDACAFGAMRRGAYFINVGRGDLVVDEDLLAALNSGQLAGATLDVFRSEPLSESHPFWSHPKVTITPHISGWHVGDAILQAAENCRRLDTGQPLINVVNRTHGY